MMTAEDLKFYSVMIGNGTGCLFQPMTKEYTYILTAKHLFYKTTDDGRGQNIESEMSDGELVPIKKHYKQLDEWKESEIEFRIIRGGNYFPHLVADIAILKINYLQGFDRILVEPVEGNKNDFQLCGFPGNSWSDNLEGERYTTYNIERFIAPGNFCYSAQLFGTLNQNNIDGMSGGGILELNAENISIVGIQSKMATKQINAQAGQIGFVPMKYFSEIIGYDENKEKLTELHPPFMGTFDFLRDEAFVLKVDFINECKIESTRIHLRNKALDVVKSDITPIAIKALFEERLLIDESEVNSLETQNIWIGWLEFLTILNIVKEKILTVNQLNDIFNCYRLKYTHIDDCTTLFIDHLSKSDYLGLKQGGMVVINSKVAPRQPINVPVGGMVGNISKPQDKKGFRTDKEMDPFQSFSFIHLDFLKTEKIINKMEDYLTLTEEQLLKQLKQEYHDLFQ